MVCSDTYDWKTCANCCEVFVMNVLFDTTLTLLKTNFYQIKPDEVMYLLPRYCLNHDNKQTKCVCTVV